MLLLLNAHCHRISASVHCRYHLSDHRGISERCTQNPARPLPRVFSGFCTSCHLLFLVQSQERCRRFIGLQYVLWECCIVPSEGHHNSLLGFENQALVGEQRTLAAGHPQVTAFRRSPSPFIVLHYELAYSSFISITIIP